MERHAKARQVAPQDLRDARRERQGGSGGESNRA